MIAENKSEIIPVITDGPQSLFKMHVGAEKTTFLKEESRGFKTVIVEM